MQTSSDKRRKIFSLSILKKPFSRNIQERTVVVQENNVAYVNRAISNEEKDKSSDVISSRSRTQRLFRSIKKKLEHKSKSVALRSKDPTPRPISSPRLDIISVNDIPNPEFHSLGKEHFNLAQHGWYWGPVSKTEAEEKLRNLPNGSFLVRDSSSDHHFYTLSFRADSSTLHARINYSCGSYSLHEGAAYPSIAALIGENRLRSFQHLLTRSRIEPWNRPAEEGERPVSLVSANIDIIPVHLKFPVSRFNEVRTLQYLCRFVIRQYISVGNIEQLPVPASVKGYLVAGHY